MHIGDLDGTGVLASGTTWQAAVTIQVHDAGHAPAGSVSVMGSWSGIGTATCTTNASGVCTLTRNLSVSGNPSITFTVMAAARSGYSYTAAANHDPDGDSNGTVIIVARP
jgi:hypothetical protein